MQRSPWRIETILVRALSPYVWRARMSRWVLLRKHLLDGSADLAVALRGVGDDVLHCARAIRERDR